MRTLLLISIILIFTSCSYKSQKADIVSTAEREILVSGKPYFIKGVCYHPVPKGSKMRNFENLSEDLKLMNEAGINTVRLYSPIDDESVLDQFHKERIKVIIGFGFNQGGNFDILSGSFADYIIKYKHHPAILFWEYGNEYNYHPEWFEGDMKNWYKALNDAAKKSKELDPNRPAATAHGELPDSLALATCPNIDIWGMNVYRWDNPETIFKEWSEISNKPMYLSEAGADSYMTIEKLGYKEGVNEKAQAAATRNILDATFRNASTCSGVAIFAFVDEYWKAGNVDTQDPGGWAPNSSGVPYDGSPNEEYWGILNIDRTPKLAFDVVKEYYLN